MIVQLQSRQGTLGKIGRIAGLIDVLASSFSDNNESVISTRSTRVCCFSTCCCVFKNKTGAIETGCFFLSCDRRCEKIFKDMDRWSLLCGSVPRVKSNFETSFSKWKTTGSLQNLHHLIEHKKDYLMVCLSKNRVCRSTDRQTPCFYCASLIYYRSSNHHQPPLVLVTTVQYSLL